MKGELGDIGDGEQTGVADVELGILGIGDVEEGVLSGAVLLEVEDAVHGVQEIAWGLDVGTYDVGTVMVGHTEAYLRDEQVLVVVA